MENFRKERDGYLSSVRQDSKERAEQGQGALSIVRIQCYAARVYIM